MFDITKIDDSIHFLDIEHDILEFINTNPLLVSSMKIDDLSSCLYTSNATIVRFCKKIGLSGFNELKYSLKESLTKNATISNKYRKTIEHHLITYKDFINTIDTSSIHQIVDIICSDCQLYIHGRSLSAIPAKYLYTVLNSIDRRCIFISDLHLLKSLSTNLDENSAVIIVSAGANSEVYHQIIEDIKIHNSKIVLVTSNPESSLNQDSSISICTNDVLQTYHSIDVNSRIELITIIQLLIELTNQKLMYK